MKAAAAEVATVARHEFLTYVRRRTFLLVTFGLPVVGMLLGTLAGGFGLLVGRGLSTALELPNEQSDARGPAIGYVDPGSFVEREPDGGPEMIRLESVEDARAAVREGRVAAAYILPADYPRSRAVEKVSTGLQVSGGETSALIALLRANLWPEATSTDLEDLENPGHRVDLALDPARYRVAGGNAAAIGLPLLLGVLLYVAIFTVSSYLLQGLTTEKETRVLEIILTSVRPTSLLVGKITGLGALGAVQMLVWGVLGSALAGAGLMVAATLAGLQTGPAVILVIALYFALGYLFYASLMAAVGAIAPSFRESGALTFVVLFPAWIPFFALEAILSEPNGRAATMFSLFPPTAPLVGVLRVVSAPVPPAEIVLSLALLLLGSVAVIAVAARLFSSTLLFSPTLPGRGAVAAAIRGRTT